MSSRQMLRMTSALRPVVLTLSRTASVSQTAVRLTRPSLIHTQLQQTTAAFHTSTCRLNQHIINIQDDNDFKDRVIQNETPVVIDFHAEWCGPCKVLGPRLESLISDRAGKVILAKVDIDKNTDLAMDYGVQAVPTVLAMKEGKVVDRFVGVQDDAQINSFINGLSGE